MKNENDIKPNLLQLESLRSELIEKTLNTNSNFLRLFLYQNYFEKTLSLNNPNLEEAFLKEFIEDYISTIQKFEVFGTNPEFTDKLLQQLKSLTSLTFIKNVLPELTTEIERIKKQKEKLFSILEGKEYEDGINHKAFFPLIDKEAPNDFYGIIESVTVRISKATESNKFIIIPSEKEIEKKISEQYKKSWQLAIDILKKYVRKPYQYHEVILSFDKKEGFYEGNSLGIALTLSFLEELLKFYNPTYIIKIKEQTAFTGGVDEKGIVLETNEEIIKRKVAAVFFSEVNTFVVPKLEETYAYFALTQLKNQYSQRNLKIIGVEDINDVLNRRDLVEIKKINPVVRSGKFVKKNWVSAAATVLLAILFAYLFAMDYDDNPANVTSDGQTLYIKNKNGRILWTKHFLLNKDLVKNDDYLSRFCRIIDVNSDGINEVLVADEQVENNHGLNTSCYLRCYDSNQELLWHFQFNEKVSTQRAELSPIYSIYMIDTLSIKNAKMLFIYANNGPSFSSAIFSINIRTGKKNPGTLWCSGHTYDGIIRDLNHDKKSDIICLGVDNGFEDVVLFGVEIDTLNKVRPSTTDYMIKDYPTAKFITYIRIPKTDYDNYIQNRFSNIGQGSFKYLNDEKKYYFILTSDYSIPVTEIWYKLKDNFMDFNISVDNQFRVKSDSLVAKGILNLPYSDTKEYENSIKDKILYWNDGQWVKRKELDK